MASGNNSPNGGRKMFTEKNCYMCKYLLFLGSSNVGGYYCTLTKIKYPRQESNFDCKLFVEEHEE